MAFEQDFKCVGCGEELKKGSRRNFTAEVLALWRDVMKKQASSMVPDGEEFDADHFLQLQSESFISKKCHTLYSSHLRQTAKLLQNANQALMLLQKQQSAEPLAVSGLGKRRSGASGYGEPKRVCISERKTTNSPHVTVSQMFQPSKIMAFNYLFF